MMQIMKKKMAGKAVTAVLGVAIVFSTLIPSGRSWPVPVTAEAAADVDILGYEKNSDATEFSIYNIAGMEKLANLVNSGKENFYGKTVILQADLMYDRSVENNYTIIGTDSSLGFSGRFKGQGHKINGVNIKSNNRYVGLFGFEKGVVEDICLENSSIVQIQGDGADGVGGIAGDVHRSGGIWGQ